MGKRKLCTSIFIGAIVGGLVALFDQETRNYTKDKLVCAKDATRNLVKNPSEALQHVKETFNQINENFSNGAENAINALEQVEQTLNKFTKK